MASATALLAVGAVAGVMAADAWLPSEPTLEKAAPTTSPPGAQSSADGPTGGGPTASAPSVSGPKSGAAPVATVEAPAFVWAALPGVRRYEVVFERGGKVVYSATTRLTRLELPLSWRYDGKTYRLVPGRYHWTVWPIVDGGRGKPLVSSDYTV